MNNDTIDVRRTDAGQFVAWVDVWQTRETGERVPVHQATKPFETEAEARLAARELLAHLLH